MEKRSESTNRSLEASLLAALRFPLNSAREDSPIPQEHSITCSKSQAYDGTSKVSSGQGEKNQNCCIESNSDVERSKSSRHCGVGELEKMATGADLLERCSGWAQLVAATTWTTCRRKMAKIHAEELAHKDALLEQQLQHLQELRQQLQLKEDQVHVLEKQLQVRKAIHMKELQERDDHWKRKFESLGRRYRSSNVLEDDMVCAVEKKTEAEVFSVGQNSNQVEGIDINGEITSHVRSFNSTKGCSGEEVVERRLGVSDALGATDPQCRRRVRQGSGQPRGPSVSNDSKSRPVCEKDGTRARALCALQGLSHFQLRKTLSQMVMRIRPETPASSEQAEVTSSGNTVAKIPSTNTLGTLSKVELAKALLEMLPPSKEATIAEAKGPLHVRRVLYDYTSKGSGA